MPPQMLVDLTQLDLNSVQHDRDGIRKLNPHRHEMEQLTAIVHIDKEENVSVAYKDISEQEFWVRGHMPGYPLMPGVLMCEAAAQLAAFHSTICNLLKGDFVGFGGMDEVRFRGMVRPGDRLLIVVKLLKIRTTSRAVFAFQEFVGDVMVCHGKMFGVPLSMNEEGSSS